MGAKGIRRRKPYRKLPPARVPTENEVIPPHIMWPGPGSGFEAHPMSPAGRAAEGLRFVTGLKRRHRPLATAFIVAVLAMTAFSLLGTLLSLLL